MGDRLDRFWVRAVVALSVIAWGSVLGHDLLDREAAAEPLHATAADEPAVVAVPTVDVPANATTPTPGQERALMVRV